MTLRRTRMVAAGAALMSACANERPPSMLEPAGPGAARVAGLWWLLLWISTVVFVVVCGLVAVSILRGRGRVWDIDRTEVRWGDPFIVVAGVALPALVLVAVFLVSLYNMNALASHGEEKLAIDVIAHNWWWEARYPNGAVTANEIHIPVGERVRLRLRSDDVIHSFWVPELQVKTDHIPGRVTTMWLQADEAGRYRGQCAEFCGLQHANMIFYIVADPAGRFEQWLAEEARSRAEPTGADASTGEKVFLNSSCVGCHTIRGTEAHGQYGPDLTHLASRTTLGAGVLANTRSNLARWIQQPQDFKPGVAMPPTELTPGELEVLLDYLEELE